MSAGASSLALLEMGMHNIFLVLEVATTMISASLSSHSSGARYLNGGVDHVPCGVTEDSGVIVEEIVN